MDYAREQVANLINANEKEIIFTSGATESNNLALKGVFEMYREKGNHIITVNIEHKAIIDTCRHLEKQGAEVTYLVPQPDGRVTAEQVEAAIKPNTILISVMYANNEIGCINPIREIGEMAHKHGVLLHTDATQSVGKIPVDVISDYIDLASFTGHKMYGPKGIGALYVRRKNPRVKVTSQLDGGGHERGMRSGTLNVTGIVGFGKACELAMNEMAEEGVRLAKLRDKLERELLTLEESYVNGSIEHRLPHITNISSGSACTSASLEPSYVLKNLGLDDELAHSSLRFGLGRFTTEEQIDFAIDHVKTAVVKLRDMSPLWEMFKEGIDLKSIEWAEH